MYKSGHNITSAWNRFMSLNVDLIQMLQDRCPHTRQDSNKTDKSSAALTWQWLVMCDVQSIWICCCRRWLSRAARVCLSWYVDILWLYHKTHAAILEEPLINELYKCSRPSTRRRRHDYNTPTSSCQGLSSACETNPLSQTNEGSIPDSVAWWTRTRKEEEEADGLDRWWWCVL